jgi:AcrR family transcriptional regulator
MTSSIELDESVDLVEEKRRVRRGETRRCEVAAVAQQIFLEKGYGQTTMQAIAERAGASKETLYRHFGSKEGLFQEIVRSKSEQIAARLDENIALHTSPDEVLFCLGFNLLKTMSCSDVRSFYGWVVAETPRAPEVGRIFYELGPSVVRAKLTAYFEHMTERKVLRCDNPTMATKLFTGSVMADFHMRAMTIGFENGLQDEDIREQVEAAVQMFLARYRYPAEG